MADWTEAPSRAPRHVGFGASSWLGRRGVRLQEGSGSVAVSHLRMKHLLPLTCTPPWALHGGMSGTRPEQLALKNRLALKTAFCGVIDLGPEAFDDLEPPLGWVEVLRHTRQVEWLEGQELNIPKTRLKQERRFTREGGCVVVGNSEARAWRSVAALHDQSRKRKGIASDAQNLHSLLNRLSREPWTFAVEAINAEGETEASGGFVMLDNGTCVYAFGGQQRSANSGRATVAMILTAMRHARELGCRRFDFGGSQDRGVDQFYSEFGAKVVFMKRWVKAPVWFAWLFPNTWRAWTRQSQHR